MLAAGARKRKQWQFQWRGRTVTQFAVCRVYCGSASLRGPSRTPLPHNLHRLHEIMIITWCFVWNQGDNPWHFITSFPNKFPVNCRVSLLPWLSYTNFMVPRTYHMCMYTMLNMLPAQIHLAHIILPLVLRVFDTHNVMLLFSLASIVDRTCLCWQLCRVGLLLII